MAFTNAQKKNLLIVLLIISIALLLLINQGNDEPEGPLFSGLERRDIQSITINFKGETKQFSKQDNYWLLTEPFKRRADMTRINILLSTLSLQKTNIYDVSSANLSELGLNPAQATLTLDDGIFDFGETNADGKQRYLRHKDQFTLIPDLVYPLLNGPFKELLELDLAPPGLIGIETKQWSIKKDQNQWMSEQFSNEKAEAIAAAWVRQDADDIVSWPLNNPEALSSSTKDPLTLITSDTHKIQLLIYKTLDLVIFHPIESNYALVVSLDKYGSLQVSE